MSVAAASLLAAALTMAASLAGILFSGSVLRSWAERNLPFLATFSAGVFLVVVFHLLVEALEAGSIALAAGGILFGATLMEALHQVLPNMHHHHDVGHGHAHTRIDGRRVLFSDALHNVGDGFLLVASFTVGPYVGIAAAAGILVHELVQEVSEFFILREAGYSTPDALIRNFIASGTVLLGVGAALFLASSSEITILFSGLAAGGFLIVLTRDLLPHTRACIAMHGGARWHAVALVVGIGLMLGVQTLIPETETYDNQKHLGATEVLSNPCV